MFLGYRLLRYPKPKVKELIPTIKISEDETKALKELVSNKPIKDSPIRLNEGERAILRLDNIDLLEYKNIKTKGMYQGISLRVIDGLSYRVGEFSAKQKEALINIDLGELIFTSERLIFLGNKESLEISLKKLLSINIAEEMLEIHQRRRSKVIFFDGLNEAWKRYVNLSEKNDGLKKESGTLRIAFIAKEILKL
jgi:hypothetical protein